MRGRLPSASEWAREEAALLADAGSRAHDYHIDLNVSVRTLPKEKLDIVLYGTHGKSVTVHYHNRDGRRATFDTPFEG